jgi:L-alanine-DL-glutamate epimerase-like enolase superfamily enzyme
VQITDIKTWLIPPRWGMIKIETDAGLCGRGEPVLEGRTATVMAAVHEMRDKLPGQDLCLHVARAPHCPLGPVALASCVQLDAVSHNALIREQRAGIHYNNGAELFDYLVVKSVLRVKDGYLAIPTGPGLGVEIDEEVVEAKAREMTRHWSSPTWELRDGCVAEW